MLGGDALVAEIAVDLVNALEAPHDQALEIKLGSNAEVEVEVESVVMRLERPRHGPARKGLHHGRLDFEETFRVEEIPNSADRAAARLENFPHFRVDHQIEVALAVADFDVGEAVPFLRQRQERLRQELQSLGVDGQLASLGPEEVPRDAHEVADVEEFIELPVAR